MISAEYIPHRVIWVLALISYNCSSSSFVAHDLALINQSRDRRITINRFVKQSINSIDIRLPFNPHPEQVLAIGSVELIQIVYYSQKLLTRLLHFGYISYSNGIWIGILSN